MKDIKVKGKSDSWKENSKNEFINEKLVLYPLYKKINIADSIWTRNILPCKDFRLELYCNKCKKRRIFSFEDSKYCSGSWEFGQLNFLGMVQKYNIDYFNITAISDCGHELIMTFKTMDNTVIKVGQYPSIYDMNENINNKKFLKQLDNEYEDYYKKACSLYSFDSCIGALTYLRRIFEKLLLETFRENETKIDIEFEIFKKERMEEKIKILRKYLPDIMQEQGFNQIYIKISDGIHNLNEEECANIFDALKFGIEEILTEKMEYKEKLERKKEIARNLQNMGNKK